MPVRVVANGTGSTHHVRCLPLDFPTWTVDRHRRPESQFYVLTPVGRHSDGYVAVFDARGVPVWWIHSSWYAPWDGKLMASSVKTGRLTFETGTPVALFNTGITTSFVDRRNQYVVTRDGQRFLVNVSAEDENSAPITVVLNWNAPSKP